jgi:DHA1 family multidrug resistance protein-like MFS transporter
VIPQGQAAVFVMVATLAFGIALVGPNVAALITRGGGSRTGAALGAQGTANGLGQTGGAVLGGTLLAWKMSAPFVVAAAMFVAVGLLVGWRRWRAGSDGFLPAT